MFGHILKMRLNSIYNFFFKCCCHGFRLNFFGALLQQKLSLKNFVLANIICLKNLNSVQNTFLLLAAKKI